ncbi:CaiB/BaiF CoA transferase family protein [Pseudomonas corrugata]|uniref:CaiB/BaiF CoA transferase family protein n=1 Tax=Pseudomonas corrugata TaxID=47879 RepID=UPI001586D446|nr:CaiB/BaiF CoA-transferase family protein [Pseudomonas corrugata]MCI0996500.1 CoA transferase [Pseudomonas corrugata]NUT64713.1 CoA transferase [Pseudomonas corrugata]
MGPLKGIRIIEIAGLGAAPYAAMMLADLGAEVLRVDRVGGNADTPLTSPLLRNRSSIMVDLKKKEGVEVVLALCEKADAIIEAFRPGVAERLGIGPQDCLARNSRLVYGRMTGWGQEGPLAQRAGHDLNYIGLTGLLNQIGPTGGKPVVPLNVIGDFGGGGLLMAYGLVCALLESGRSGQGQVVDAAMMDGAISFMAMFFGYRAEGQFIDAPGANFLGGGAHYYDVYACSDGKFLSVAPIEPAFYRTFVERLELDAERFLPAGYPAYTQRHIEELWPALKLELEALFKTRPRDEWCALFEGLDACVTPVLSLADAPSHPHNIARKTFVEVGGILQNAPAPRFSRTVAEAPRPPVEPGVSREQVVADWHLDQQLITRALAAGALI